MVGAIPIGVAGCIYKSNTMISSSVIGIIFHTYPNNKILKYTDLLFNVLLSCNASLYSNDIMILAIMSSICYLLNDNIIDQAIFFSTTKKSQLIRPLNQEQTH